MAWTFGSPEAALIFVASALSGDVSVSVVAFSNNGAISADTSAHEWKSVPSI